MTKIKLLAFTKIEFLVVLSIIGMLAGLLLPAIPSRMTLLTKKTQADLENIRHLIFDMDFDKAIQAAEAIRQEAGREVAYYEIVYHLVEAERFDEAQKYISKIGSAFVRHERPPLSMVIQSRLAETLAAVERFDEAEQALKNAAYKKDTAAVVILLLLNADRYDDAARLLDKYDVSSDLSCRFFAVRFAKNGDYQKAIDIAKSIYSDDWRNEAYQEIIREQLKQDQYQDAIQTFSHIDILRYKQQSVAIFVVYLLEKGRADEAKKLAERFKSPDPVTVQNSETDNDPFTTTPDEWNKYTGIKRWRPFSSTEWQRTIADIFASFKQLDQSDTKATSLTEPDDTISDARLKVFLADIESMSDVYDSNIDLEKKFVEANELFNKVIKQLVKLNRTKEALSYVEHLRKRCRSLRAHRLYQRYYFLSAGRINEMPINHHFDFSSYWNNDLYCLLDTQISVGQLDEALSTIRKLHVTDPKGCSEARRVIAEALFEARRIDEAKEQASLALKFAERAGNYNLDLVSMLFKIGQVAEAQLVLSKIETPSVLDDDPNHWFKSPVDVKIERQKIDHWREILEKKE